MTLNPRLLVVTSAALNYVNNTEFVDLAVLSREASATFDHTFPKEDRWNLDRLMSYVGGNALVELGKPDVSFSARTRIQLQGNKYTLGDVLTEKEAFDLGYHAPHLDTQCARIGQLVYDYDSHMRSGLEEALRSEGLITDDQTIVRNNGFHVIQKDCAESYGQGMRIRGLNSTKRPITLFGFKPVEGMIPVGCAAFLQSVNTIYEFMTYPPVLERRE